ncbi:MAG TPA: MFS transporter [Streptosporangiaceae bacterium]|jgi:MFS family permease|nr:MFS transporter [Streptosporangiaceae bacterium]
MAGIRAGLRDRLTRNPYAEIFRIPGAWRFSAAALIGRMQMSMYGLGTVLLVAAGTGRYGMAGAVASSGALGSAFCAPQFAKLADRRGQRTVLRPLVLVFAVAVAVLIAAVDLHVPVWALFIPAVVSGATMPSLGSMVRARWSNLLADTPQLHTAFSFESVADEVVFVLGPAAVTVLATEVRPFAGLLVATVLCVAGVLWFVAQRSTEPPAMSPAVLLPRESPRQAPRGRGTAAPALIVLVPVYLFLGAMFVSVDLSTVAFAQHFGYKALSGLILGTYALGSATGGLWYGSRSWRSPVERRFAVTLALTALGVATFWLQPDLLTLVPVIYLSGLTIAPTLIAGFSLVQAQARPGRGTEALTWLSTGIAVGVATGSSVVGFVIDAHGARWGYVFAASCGATSAAICLAGLRRLR